MDENRKEIIQKNIQVCFHVLCNKVRYRIIGMNEQIIKWLLCQLNIWKLNSKLLLYIMLINKSIPDESKR